MPIAKDNLDVLIRNSELVERAAPIWSTLFLEMFALNFLVGRFVGSRLVMLEYPYDGRLR